MASKIISYEGREYIIIKEYENFILYKDMLTGCKESFNKQELGLIKETPKLEREANCGGICKH